MVFPRLAHLAIDLLPPGIDSIFGHVVRNSSESVAANATAMNTTISSVATNVSAAAAQTSAVVDSASKATGNGFFNWMSDLMQFESVGFGGMLSYFSSRWALATFAVSILLNRTHFYASSRQNLSIQWRTRVVLYALPIVLLLVQTLWILRAMRCQTAPDYALLRYGDPNKKLAINSGGEGGFMYSLSSRLLFWEGDSASCSAMNMSLREDRNKLKVVGSFSLVWRFFITLCISQFVETLACALQGRQPQAETGMTTFEHSLAFAECEAMISSALGLGIFNTSKNDKPTSASSGSSSDSILMTRSMILRYMNVPSEVLLMSFISCLSHLSSSILAVTGLRQRFRLVNTAIWALCYMAAFIWSFVRVLKEPFGSDSDLGILRLPTVCIIGFIPHIMILIGISICAVIYGIALLVTATSLPPGSPSNPTLRERFDIAFHNLLANVQFSSSSSIRLNWQEDFYTTLLKAGFNILTAASEAVYLNEGSTVTIREMTWLEEKRIHQITARSTRQITSHIPVELLGEQIARGLEYTDDGSSSGHSGYARERKSRTAKDSETSQAGSLDSGLGLAERRSRWQLALSFFKGIGVLIVRVFARLAIHMLDSFGVERKPGWLMAQADFDPKRRDLGRNSADTKSRDFWVISPDGSLTLPRDTDVDVEAETRRRLTAFNPTMSEEFLDLNLYSWWKTGGWWGEVDTSGEYTRSTQDDDDTTSVVSFASSADTDNNWDTESDSDASGRVTPTQSDPYPARTTGADRSFGISDLARLLDPKTVEDREEAQMLSRHLQSERPMTRALYRRRINADRARILPLSRYASAIDTASASSATTTSLELDEEAALEQFILHRRTQTRGSSGGQMPTQAVGGDSSWATGAAGMGASGPQCVVCQSAPRVILVWPCGCLSICDDCRIGVATRNFANCLCCRTAVVAYSRLYVP